MGRERVGLDWGRGAPQEVSVVFTALSEQEEKRREEKKSKCISGLKIRLSEELMCTLPFGVVRLVCDLFFAETTAAAISTA